MDSLYKTWSSLSAPAPNAWTARAVSELARIARTPVGGAAVLVRVRNAPDTDPKFGLRTSHVEYTPSCSLTVEGAEGNEQGTFAVLSCHGDAELVRHFLRLAEMLPLDGRGPEGAAAFDDSVRQAFELFRGLHRPGTRTVQGIWVETLLVAFAKNPAYLVQAWHSDPTALHDFVGDGVRIEVKSSARGLREHEISLAQLTSATEKTVLASVLVEHDDGGATILDLLDRIAARCADVELARRAETVVAESLGEQWRDARDTRFNVASALESLRFYLAEHIPRPPDPIPATVRDVRFRVDLSGTPTLPEGQSDHALLVALLPLDRST